MQNDNSINLKVIIEGIGERFVSLDMKQLVGHLKVEHFMLGCPLGPHSQEELANFDFDCEKCRGTNYVLHPAGEAIAQIIKREQKVLLKNQRQEIKEHFGEISE